jgi:1-acyl-sn-glycerol-3-phosphate acyltransferase
MQHCISRFFRSAYEHGVLYFALVLLGVLSILWTPIAVALRLLLPRACGEIVGRAVITSVFRAYLGTLSFLRACRFDLTALDALRGEPAMIIAPNHPGLLDAVLIISRLPVTCIMKADLMRNLFLGAGARLAGYIGNHTAQAMIGRSVASLKNGTHLLVFPEGTRTLRLPVNPFLGSTGIIARHAGVSVQTVFIDTDSPYLSKGWPLFRKPAIPITYRIRLGRRFDAPAKAREFVAELERYFAEELSRDSMMRSWLPQRTGTGPNPD